MAAGTYAAELLVVILHVAFTLLGCLRARRCCWTISVCALLGSTPGPPGAIGCMTLAVMTRATRGHTAASRCTPCFHLWHLCACSHGAAISTRRALPAVDPERLRAAVLWVIAFLGYKWSSADH